jgi:hypothetical protein
MSKSPSILSLLVAAVTGFGNHLVTLGANARSRLLGRPAATRRPINRRPTKR